VAGQNQLPAYQKELKSEISDIKTAQSEFEEAVTDLLERQLRA
jgi:hypothetical protein